MDIDNTKRKDFIINLNKAYINMLNTLENIPTGATKLILWHTSTGVWGITLKSILGSEELWKVTWYVAKNDNHLQPSNETKNNYPLLETLNDTLYKTFELLVLNKLK